MILSVRESVGLQSLIASQLTDFLRQTPGPTESLWVVFPRRVGITLRGLGIIYKSLSYLDLTQRRSGAPKLLDAKQIENIHFHWHSTC